MESPFWRRGGRGFAESLWSPAVRSLRALARKMRTYGHDGLFLMFLLVDAPGVVASRGATTPILAQ